MKDAMAALLAAIRRARATLTRPGAAQLGGRARRNSAHTIGQLISALNDRNVAAALCLLEPPAEGSENSHGQTRKCVGCGE
jgi:hypothetical protein